MMDDDPMSSGYPLTKGLAHFASHPPPAPAKALDVARDGLTDAFGLLVAAREEPVVQAALHHALEGQPAGCASVLLGPARARSRDAAFVNATACHAFAMDDVAFNCHPSAVLMPALLAAGESTGASGADLLRGWLVGYEVLAELALREPASWHATGWHPTGVVAPVAVAAGVCHVLRCTPEVTQHALAIAASFTGGLQANFGTDTKALHAGRASAAGLEAAQLARLGVTASSTALEHDKGLLSVLSPGRQADLQREFDPFQPAWHAAQAGVAIKKYPLCYTVHRIADAAIDLGHRPEFDADRVSTIDVWIGIRQAAMARYSQPLNALEAKYSAPFAVASGLIARAAGFAQLQPEFFGSDAVRRLVARTRLHVVEDTNADDPLFAPADRVLVTLDNGAVLDSGLVRFARGHPCLPMAPEQLRQKFMDCAGALGAMKASRLFDVLQGLEALQDVRAIAAIEGE